MSVDAETCKEIIKFLVKTFTQDDIESALKDAFWGENILQRIPNSRTLRKYVEEVFELVFYHDNSALEKYLQALKTYTGDSNHKQLDNFIYRTNPYRNIKIKTPKLPISYSDKKLPVTTSSIVTNLTQQGTKARHEKEYRIALNYYNQALEITPDHIDALNGRARIFLDTEDYTQALDNYARIIQFEPDYVPAYLNRALIYTYGTQQYDLAIVEYDIPLDLEPRNSRIFRMRAETFRRASKYKLSIRDYNQAIAISPNHLPIYYDRAEIRYENGKHGVALADCNYILKRDNEYLDALILRGAIHAWNANYDQAIVDYDRALELDSGSTGALWGRAYAHYETSSYEAALSDYLQYKKLTRQRNTFLERQIAKLEAALKNK